MTDINIKSSTIEKGLDLVKGFVERILGPAIDEQGLMFQDNVKLRRYKNQLRLLNKAKEITEKENIDVKQINFKAFAPLLEGAALEEDETLQDMYANLLVNYIDSSKNLTVTVYPKILSELSTNEIRIIKYMSENKNTLEYSDETCDFDLEEVGNLQRLGLIEPHTRYSVLDDNGEPFVGASADSFLLNYFGHSFLKACTR